MSVAFGALARRAHTVNQSSANFVARRGLGETTRGPAVTDIGANLTLAKKFFQGETISYHAFKQQCNSLRIFAFAGVCGGCALSLFLDPPKSSYWVRWGPTYYFTSVRETFAPNSPPVFLSEKIEGEVNVPEVVSQIITSRRLAGEGEEEEEH